MRSDVELAAFVDGAHRYRPSGGGAGALLPYLLFGDAQPILINQWLIKGVLPRRGVAVIYGPSGGGKTFVAIDLVASIASGGSWRGRRTLRAGVLYLAPDGGAAICNRMVAYRLHHGIAAADIAAVTCPVDLLGKLNAGDLDKIEDLIDHIGAAHGFSIGVVVIDTVSRAMPAGDENQPADMSRFVDNLCKLGADGDRLIIGIHHTPKADGTVLRGHGSLHGAADCEMNVLDGTIRIAKQRDGQDGLEFGFRLEVVDIGTDEDGEAVTSCVAVAADVAAAGTKLVGAAKVALELLRTAVIECGEAPPADRHVPPHVRVVSLSLWREYCARGQVSASDDPDSRGRAFKRAADRLQQAGLIGIWGDTAWLAC